PSNTLTLTTLANYWVNGGSVGYLLWVHRSLNWDEARKFCQDMGGDLPVLNNATKRIDMMNFASGKSSSYWVCGNDRSGAWLWLNGYGQVTDGWRYDQPNEDEGDDTCLYMSSSETLLDYPCTNSNNFYCQK
ncbi:unnamed protein product, partial [Meganyctiphanes norvegica]